MLLEAVGADLLEVVLGGDPAGGARQRAVERHEVRPRLMQHELHLVRVDDHDLLHLFLELRPLRALEAELHVLGGERVAVVEFHALAQGEFVDEPILAHRPGFREAVRHEVSGHRLYQRVVQRVQHPERCKIAEEKLPRIEPGRRQGHVKRKPHLAFRFGLCRRGARTANGQHRCEDHARGKLLPSLHRRFSSLRRIDRGQRAWRIIYTTSAPILGRMGNDGRPSDTGPKVRQISNDSSGSVSRRYCAGVRTGQTGGELPFPICAARAAHA